MKSVLGFFSLLAFGFLAAGVMVVISSNSSTVMPFGLGGADRHGIDLGSLLLGMVLGFLLSALARVSWSELPRRTVSWMLNNERTFYRLAWAGLFAIILFYY